MEKLKELETIVLTTIDYYLAMTPPYYYITIGGLVCFAMVASIFVVFFLFVRKDISKLAFWEYLILMLGSIFFLINYDRPNLAVNYGYRVEAVVGSEANINFDNCYFGNADYKIANKIGKEAYAKRKAQAILEASQDSKNSKKGCGSISNY